MVNLLPKGLVTVNDGKQQINNEDDEKIKKERGFVIQANLVKILKTQQGKSIQHTELVQ